MDLKAMVGVRCYGTERLLLRIQSAMEDITNSVENDDVDHIVWLAREVVEISLSIHSLAVDGEIWWRPDELFFDPVSGLDEALVAQARSVASAACDLEGATPEARKLWLQSLRRVTSEVEVLASGGAEVLELRSSEGMWRSLRMARDWLTIVEDFGLPSPFPEWMTESWDELDAPPEPNADRAE